MLYGEQPYEAFSIEKRIADMVELRSTKNRFPDPGASKSDSSVRKFDTIDMKASPSTQPSTLLSKKKTTYPKPMALLYTMMPGSKCYVNIKVFDFLFIVQNQVR